MVTARQAAALPAKPRFVCQAPQNSMPLAKGRTGVRRRSIHAAEDGELRVFVAVDYTVSSGYVRGPNWFPYAVLRRQLSMTKVTMCGLAIALQRDQPTWKPSPLEVVVDLELNPQVRIRLAVSLDLTQVSHF